MGKLQLKELKLKNIKQHKDRHWLFDTKNGIASLIGIAGANGSGKSTILDSLLFLFTGDIPGENKADLISWAAPGGKAYVEALFLFNGKPLELYREASGSGAQMVYDGNKIKGITSVNAALEELTGLDRDLCQKSIFVRQNDITDVLFTEPAKRRKAWQRLMGMGSAEATYIALGNYISSIPKVPDRKESLENGKLRLLAIRGEIARLRKQDPGPQDTSNIEELKRWLAEAEMAEREVNNAMVAEQKAKQNLNAITAKLQELQEVKQLACNTVESLKKELSALPPIPTHEELAKLVTKLNEIKQSKKAFTEAQVIEENLKEYLTKYQETNNKYNTIIQNNCELSTLEQQIQSSHGKIEVLKAECSQLEGLLAALSKNTSGNSTCCPLCEQQVENQELLISSLKNRIAIIKASLNSEETLYKNTVAQKQKLENDINLITKTLNETQQNIAILNSKKESIAARITCSCTAEDLAAIETDVKTANSLIAKYNELNNSLKKFETGILREYNEICIECAKAQNIFDATSERLSKAKIAYADYAKDDNIIKAKQLLKDLETANAEHVRLSGERAGLIKAAKELIKELKAIKTEIKRDEKKLKAIAILEEVRDFFHNTQGPSLVVSRVLEDITSGINEFLGYFNAPYIVVPDFEQTSFRCVFTDGRPSPEEPPLVNVLSGGQKVALALSFRLASYYMFSNRMGFITIDEPTNHLDDENISNFRHLIDRLKTLSKETGLQILISTHSQIIVDAMDYVINLNTDKQ